MQKKMSIPLPPKEKMPSKTSQSDGATPDADIAFVTKIANLLEKANVSEIEVEREGLRVRVSRHSPAAQQVVYAPAPAAAAPAPAAAPAAPAAPSALAAPAAADLSKHPGAVLSPMVGTAYVAPQPGAAPFVQVGDTVKEDQTLLIVEAMKTMNPIPAPKAGRITQIIVKDATPVEFGEVLMIIE